MNDRIFLRCNKCGNIVGVINDSGVPIVCCGEKMEALKANSKDAAVEKHVPVIDKIGDHKIKVTVGFVEHPMIDEHYIEWIVVAQKNSTQRRMLKPGDDPSAEFYVSDSAFTVYAYCNLHGLWTNKGVVEE